MADFIKNILGGGSASKQAPLAEDGDFADYAGAPDPSPASIIPGSPGIPLPESTGAARPFTKWYRVWERTSPADFQFEMFVAPFVLIVIFFHFWGTRVNRKKAREWMAAHAPVLQQEFAVVGFGGPPRAPSADEIQSQGLAQSLANEQSLVPEELLKETAANEFTSYATGRQNVAFVDIKLTLLRRYNPIMRYTEAAVGFFFESMPAPEERAEVSIYNFDGRESTLVPPPRDGSKTKAGNSNYDGFVWAVVHKNLMKQLRDERYDLSLTTTKDNAKLPVWTTVMSESAEITDALLTPDLIKAIEAAGDSFEALIVTDQPIDKPTKLDDLIPKKRITLSLRLPSSDSYTAHLPIFQAALRLPDTLVTSGRFRAEALRRVKATRDDEMKKIRKIDEIEKAEDRKLKADKAKKEKRDAQLKGLSADEQRKFLDKEREKDLRRGQKRSTVKG